MSTMTWDETHRRWKALRTIEEQLSSSQSLELPWTEEYAELFGDRAGLVAALRYRWQLAVNAQLDTHLPEQVLEEQRRRLEERARGVRRLLERYSEGDEAAHRVVA
ncbi:MULTISPECIES: hypothetical protein [Nocardioides]|uniref:Uncharacterized protein n=1 Tax=Nocardioides vastitatis TaxID=2568655 RepID=A0ABW0ZGY0_9ACTN|nr:hypothetical protein [Nocardioides sp.]THI93728.1 hypothetical protein E7Z54_20720 [Nocardioides sp.]